jgi:hypothetical protein
VGKANRHKAIIMKIIQNGCGKAGGEEIELREY